MAVYDFFQIAGEVFIESGCGTVCFRQSDGFGEQATRARPSRPQHRDGQLAAFALDHHFRACTYTGHQLGHRTTACGVLASRTNELKG